MPILMRISPDGRQLVSRGSDLAVRVWDTARSEQDREIGPFRMVASLALWPDGKVLAAVNNPSCTRLSLDGTTGAGR